MLRNIVPRQGCIPYPSWHVLSSANCPKHVVVSKYGNHKREPFDRLRTGPSTSSGQVQRIGKWCEYFFLNSWHCARRVNSPICKIRVPQKHSTGKEHAENLQITPWTPCALWQSFLAHSFDTLRPDKIMRCYTLSCIMQPIANNRQFTYRSASHCQRNACSQSAAWISSPSPSAINGGMDG